MPCGVRQPDGLLKKQTMWLLCDVVQGEVERVAVYALCEYVSNYYGAMARARTEDNVMRSYRQRQQDNSISASCTASPGSHNGNHPPTDTHTHSHKHY